KYVVLRSVRPNDYPDILRWQNDPDIFYWMDYTHPFALEDVIESERNAVQEGHPFLIEANGKGIGRVGLNNFRPRDGLAALYIFVGEKIEWGKHLGLDALIATLVFGFDYLELRMIELWMLDGNERARHMYKTAGFIEEARLPARSLKAGVFVDHVWMSVTREAFAEARALYGI
ncbi:MAG: GNAT family N-acetyltransferase, partial [Actinobacteria bacterium]|nr:GNAT family N-acetyltransferase [Actinomycetota bacterium]